MNSSIGDNMDGSKYYAKWNRVRERHTEWSQLHVNLKPRQNESRQRYRE